MKANIILVVYNHDIRAISIIKLVRLGTLAASSIYLVDNGADKFNNAQIATELGIHYFNMKTNVGLSAAYNYALDRMESCDLVIFFDDDTYIPPEYFASLESAYHSGGDVFVPIVRGQDGKVYSPNEAGIFKNRLYQDPSHGVRRNRFNAIMSGMVVRGEIFASYRFNESLFVDQVDQKFFDDQRALGRSFVILHTEMTQNFHQRSDQIEAEAAWSRVKCRILDLISYYALTANWLVRQLGYAKCVYLGAQMSIRSRSPKVLLKTLIMVSSEIRQREIRS